MDKNETNNLAIIYLESLNYFCYNMAVEEGRVGTGVRPVRRPSLRSANIGQNLRKVVKGLVLPAAVIFDVVSKKNKS